MAFPYREITKKDAVNDYLKLVELNSKTISNSKVGIKACDYIFQRERYNTPYKNKKSKVEAWRDKKVRDKTIQYVRKWRSIGDTDDVTKSEIRSVLSLTFGSVQNFKPAVAKYIYTRFRAKSVLDPSAGWGNRLLAAMSLDIDYIGIDSNPKLRSGYKKMIDTFKSDSNVRIINAKSQNVDFSKFSYDMIFTSPPYFNTEKYHGMDYVDDSTFINDYFIPTFSNAYNHLQKGGHLCINCPYSMIKHLAYLGKFKKIKMPIISRKTGGYDAHEWIYWIKK